MREKGGEHKAASVSLTPTWSLNDAAIIVSFAITD